LKRTDFFRVVNPTNKPNINEPEQVMKSIKNIKSRGATMAEYVVVLAVIVVATVGLFRTFGTTIGQKVTEANTAINQ